MKITHFFIVRPIFATVISLAIVILGAVSYVGLPVAQYPEIAPPTIVVRAAYPGANAETVAATVATPLEQEINGVENMLYMSSYSTADGSMSLTITFALGTDLDTAQVLVQNRVAIAEPRLPREVRDLGVTTQKSSPDLMMVVHMLSPDESYDQLYVSNYARTRVRDPLMRLNGVGNLILFGERQFAVRVWLNPDRLAAFGLSAADVVQALREQNVQVSGGAIGAPPAPAGTAFQVIVQTQGRFDNPKQFEDVIIRSTADGRLIRVRDVARVELGAQSYVTNSYLSGKPAVALAIFQRPGTNALDAADAITAEMATLSADFPPGLDYEIVYNPTEFIADSVAAVYTTLWQAALLVMLVVLVFLQSWRTALIPIIAIPVSLIGTCAVMAAFGFSLNLLTLFGLVLAIGIVVDDAIVVVENVERTIADGLAPKDAARVTMDEVGTAVIATTLVLVAVFVPAAFVPGITGQFMRQFALTIAVSTVISTIVSLTLSPALAGLLLRPKGTTAARNPVARLGSTLAAGFNAGFDRLAAGYGGLVGLLTGNRLAILGMLVLFGGMLWLTATLNDRIPKGFIPTLDQGYAIVVVQLPDGASLNRTDAVILRASEIVNSTPGVVDAVAFAGFSGATFTNATNAGVIFARFDSFENRLARQQPAGAIIGQLFGRLQAIREAFVIAIPPPPVRGVGTSGGFKIQLQEHNSAEIDRVLQSAYRMMAQARQNPKLTGVFTTSSASSPQVWLDIDRTRARMLNVPIPNIFETLSINMGAAYVNDFNALGRVYQVRAQADQGYRLEEDDILQLKVPSATGALVPLGTLVDVRTVTGPDLVQRYNMFVSVPLQGNAAPGVSSGDALAEMEALAEALPAGLGYEWTELAYQEKRVGDTTLYIFALSVLLVFLVLAAQYESWVLPLAIILIVPLAMLSAFGGVMLRGLDNNILTQVGLVVLVGLAAKNAIMIVEFARQQEGQGLRPGPAVVAACRLRLRPILMTAFSFVLGVLPLLVATGPGAEMRQALGTAVFFGMLGVTLFGLVLTPVFYVVLRSLFGGRSAPAG